MLVLGVLNIVAWLSLYRGSSAELPITREIIGPRPASPGPVESNATPTKNTVAPCTPIIRTSDPAFCTCGEDHTCSLRNLSDTRACANTQQQPTFGIGCGELAQLRTPAGFLIELVKRVVQGLPCFSEPYVGWVAGAKWPPPERIPVTYTMVGRRRLDNVHFLLEEVIRTGVPGDFIETGAWRGGTCMLAEAVFLAYNQLSRRVFVADSFKGIPPVNATAFPADGSHVGADKLAILTDNSRAIVEANFERVGLLSDRVVFLEGWFKDTLPEAVASGRLSKVAVLRLDGDIYESTMQALETLYDLVSDRGFVIVDDYTDWKGCRAAVGEFRQKRGITSPLHLAYHERVEVPRGVWWQKNSLTG